VLAVAVAVGVGVAVAVGVAVGVGVAVAVAAEVWKIVDASSGHAAKRGHKAITSPPHKAVLHVMVRLGIFCDTKPLPAWRSRLEAKTSNENVRRRARASAALGEDSVGPLGLGGYASGEILAIRVFGQDCAEKRTDGF
jgi:hypothetical protein